MAERSDPVILITGAGQLQGKRAALVLAHPGAQLALNDLNPTSLDDLQALVEARGAKAKTYLEDITKSMPVRVLVDQVITDFGRIDAVVNCAAAMPRQSLLRLDEWDWHRSLDVNLTSTYLLLQAVAASMQAQGGGWLIACGAVLPSQESLEAGAAYQAGKAGLMAFVQAAAKELASVGIQIFGISAPMTDPFPAENYGDKEPAPREFGSLVRWLCSKSRNAFSGTVFPYTVIEVDD
jgi:NAD(P)-dependent dehydrogenase (short-subunit alcohol dehydrogenase family)